MARTLMDVLGVASPGLASVANPSPHNPHIGASLIPGVALGVGGYVLGGRVKHPVLGFFLAESVGMNAYRFYRNSPGDRTVAFTNLGVTLAAVTTSLAWKKHPFYGYLAGMALGIAATSFVPGSNAAKLVHG